MWVLLGRQYFTSCTLGLLGKSRRSTQGSDGLLASKKKRCEEPGEENVHTHTHTSQHHAHTKDEAKDRWTGVWELRMRIMGACRVVARARAREPATVARSHVCAHAHEPLCMDTN